MLTEDLFKADWEELVIHFSNDRRLDEQCVIKLSHLRYVKRLILYQDGPATNFYIPTLFRNIHLRKLYVQHLVIHSVNFHKTKSLLKVMQKAHVDLLEIIFADVQVDSQGYVFGSGMPMSKIVSPQPSHLILTNIHNGDIGNIKLLLLRLESGLSSIWLQQVQEDVKKLHLVTHIENLHVCYGFPFSILSNINVNNLYIHANSLTEVLNFDEHHLHPLESGEISPKKSNVSYANNVIVQANLASPLYLVKVAGRDIYDLHITKNLYDIHKPLKHKSIVQHKKIPPNWANLYLSAP
jgi:hypothetical protein